MLSHHNSAVWIGLAAAAVLAAAAGFCVYANTYSGVFPGVTMAGIELEGKGLKELRDTLTQALPSSLDGQEVTVTAGGETLGTYSLTAASDWRVQGRGRVCQPGPCNR